MMASILNYKINKDHVALRLKLSFDESKELNGCINNIHLIPEGNAQTLSSVYERGKNGHTKYLLIPKELRKSTKINKQATCLKLDCGDKFVFAFVMDKV